MFLLLVKKVCFLIISVYQKTKNSASEFLWVQKLTGNTRNLSSNTNEEIQDNTDPVSKLKILLV